VKIEVNYELCCHFVNEIMTLEIYWILTNHLNKIFGIDFVFTLSMTVSYHSFSNYGVVIVYFLLHLWSRDRLFFSLSGLPVEVIG